MQASSAVTTLVALFAIVSPITAIPVFLALTAGRSASERRSVALKTALVSGLTLLLAYFLGEVILQLLGIDINAFRIAGALVIGGIGWAMVQGNKVSMAANSSGAAVVPLAIPLMAGPGAIAATITIRSTEGGAVLQNIAIIFALTILSFALFLLAQPLAKALGETGLNIVSRIFGLLLISIAVSSGISAVGAAFPGLLHSST
jgi:multiple antibiotic resistance protein